MQRVRLESGFIVERLTKAEQDAVWKELDVDVSGIGDGTLFYTPHCNLPYEIVKEVETSFEKYDVTLKVNGKLHTIKTTLCNQQAQVYKKVRKLNGK